VPDHPWVDDASAAAVRIAMTCATLDEAAPATLVRVVHERPAPRTDSGVEIDLETASGLTSPIHANLRVGADVASASLVALRANAGISGMGVALHGAGFILTRDEAMRFGFGKFGKKNSAIRRYVGGKDLVQTRRERYIIDFSSLTEDEAAALNPEAYQHVLEHVLPERRLNRRESIRKLWWRFGWERPLVRRAIAGLNRYIATTETAKQRIFQFVDAAYLPDHMIVVIASDDAFLLGVLSCNVHVTWTLSTGGTLEDRPRYNKSVCFDPFPFPACSDAQKKRIRDLGEALDAHRKRQQDKHMELTLTGIYDVLEKLRRGEPLSDKDKLIHEHGLVSVLAKIHDDLDAAVFDAYGFERALTAEQLLEKLVALRAERADEERRGVVRWLRPEFQHPSGAREATQPALLATEDGETAPVSPIASRPWPKKLAEQIAAVRDRVHAAGRSLSVAEVAAAFTHAWRKDKDKDVEELLDGLVAVGALVAFDTDAGRRFQPLSADRASRVARGP
jgi:hypothetical protein